MTWAEHVAAELARPTLRAAREAVERAKAELARTDAILETQAKALSLTTSDGHNDR